MGSKRAPLTERDVVAGLKAAGFIQMPTKATSHTKWCLDVVKRGGKPHRYSVTVDGPKSPFHIKLIKSMAKQAGMNLNQFYEICSKNGQKKAKRGELRWLEKLREGALPTGSPQTEG